jgi:hypothetical protein
MVFPPGAVEPPGSDAAEFVAVELELVHATKASESVNPAAKRR